METDDQVAGTSEPTDHQQQNPTVRLVLSIPEFCQSVGLSRSAVYLEIKAGRLRPRKCGRRTLIPIDEAHRWIAELPEFAPEDPLGTE